MCAQRLVCYCESEININLGSRACRGFWWLKTEAVCHRATHQVPQSSRQRVVCCSLENSGPHLKNGSLADIFQPEFISSISRHKAVFSFTLPAYAALLFYFSCLFFFRHRALLLSGLGTHFFPPSPPFSSPPISPKRFGTRGIPSAPAQVFSGSEGCPFTRYHPTGTRKTSIIRLGRDGA